MSSIASHNDIIANMGNVRSLKESLQKLKKSNEYTFT